MLLIQCNTKRLETSFSKITAFSVLGPPQLPKLEVKKSYSAIVKYFIVKSWLKPNISVFHTKYQIFLFITKYQVFVLPIIILVVLPHNFDI